MAGLWARSYSRQDGFQIPFNDKTQYDVILVTGRLAFARYELEKQDLATGVSIVSCDIANVKGNIMEVRSVGIPIPFPWEEPSFSFSRVAAQSYTFRAISITLPHWLFVAAFGAYPVLYVFVKRWRKRMDRGKTQAKGAYL
jgi:hypothetical protein